MKISQTVKRVLPFLLVLAFVSVLAVPGAQAVKTYKMKGTITAIDQQDNTVVVNVPLEKKEVYTVAGPLAPNAILKKGGKTGVSLKDFNVGDPVIVEWEVTDKGHLIKMLAAK